MIFWANKVSYLKSVYQKALGMVFSSVRAGISDLKQDSYNNQISQRQLFLHYQGLKNQSLPLPRFQDTGFRVYSQNDEDGLLLYIFSIIGFTNKICVDMAFVKLGREKGYRLVGINKYGFNAFFIKNGIGDEFLPEIKASDCFNHPKVKEGIMERHPKVKDLPWVEV